MTGCWIELHVIENRPPEHVRQIHIQRHRNRLEFPHQGQRLRTARSDQCFEARVASQDIQHPRVIYIVLDNEQYAVAGLQSVAIVGYPLRVTILKSNDYGRLGHRKYWGLRRTARSRPSVHLRQVKRERAAGSCRATQLNLAAKKACQFTADGETETGPTILPARARI